MKRELPALFNGEMVRAILSGDKTNTMRPVKYVPALGQPEVWCPDVGTPFFARAAGQVARFGPFGMPGDLLYVRETFLETGDDFEDIVYQASDPGGNILSPCDFSFGSGGYPSSCRDMPGCVGCYPSRHPWRPSIHMPKRAARIWLEVLDVHVMRVQDVTDEHALSEGCPRQEWFTVTGGPTKWFRTTWDGIYCDGRENLLSVASNPWCWSYSFRVLSTTGRNF